MDLDLYPKDDPDASVLIDRAIAWGLEPGDLAVSQLVAGRQHDRELVKTLLSYGLVEKSSLEERLASADISNEQRSTIAAFLAGPR